MKTLFINAANHLSPSRSNVTIAWWGWLGIVGWLFVGGVGSTTSLAQSTAVTTPPTQTTRVTEVELFIDLDQSLNANADRVGVWLNTNTDVLSDAYVEQLRNLRFNVLRYGWQFGLLDLSDLRSQKQLPRDPAAAGFFADRGRMAEKFGPGGAAELLQRTFADGYAVLNTDAIQYIGRHDATLAKTPESERIDGLTRHAAAWAKWGHSRRFSHFEIGNENDLSGTGETEDAIGPWTPRQYADVAMHFVQAIRRVRPDAKVGINGGLKDADANRIWFNGIVEAQPDLASQIDFLVAHKYEMWLDYPTWRDHPRWDFGRVGEDFRNLHRELFPKTQIQVTELGSWMNSDVGEAQSHYRNLLMLEMLGNVRLDAAVDAAIVWPTRWAGLPGILQTDADALSPMGLGVSAYTRFNRGAMVFNRAAGPVRCFCTADDQFVCTTIINHSPNQTRVALRYDRTLDHAANVWHLHSPSNDPMAGDTELVELAPLQFKRTDLQSNCVVTAPATSAVILVIQRDR